MSTRVLRASSLSTICPSPAMAASRIQHHTSSQIRTLSIGCIGESSFDLVQKTLAVCRGQIPAFHPFLRVLSHPSQLTLFYQGEVELLFGFRDDVPLRDEMVFRELCRLPLCCVLPADHPLADSATISRQELAGEKLITCPSYAIPVLIRAGYGYSILPQTAAAEPALRYITLQDAEPLSYGIFYKKGRKSPLLREVISVVLSVTL